MKSPAGKPRARRPAERRPVQLDLRRTPTWPEEDATNEQPDSYFWRWFAVVLLLHLIAFLVLTAFFHHRPKPPEEFVSLLPPGEMVKGNPGASTAPKIAPTIPAPSHPAPTTAAPPPRPHVTPTPPRPTAPQAKPPPILDQHPTVPAP